MQKRMLDNERRAKYFLDLISQQALTQYSGSRPSIDAPQLARQLATAGKYDHRGIVFILQ